MQALLPGTRPLLKKPSAHGEHEGAAGSNAALAKPGRHALQSASEVAATIFVVVVPADQGGKVGKDGVGAVATVGHTTTGDAEEIEVGQGQQGGAFPSSANHLPINA